MGAPWILPRRLRASRAHAFLFLLFALLSAIFYLAANEQDDDDSQYFTWSPYRVADEVPEQKYLVWNSKCRMLSISPNDSSIGRFVKKEEFEACSTKPRLSSISKSNASAYLLVDRDVAAEYYGNVSCCWAEVTRGGPPTANNAAANVDSLISVGDCQHFQDRALLDKRIQVVLIVCHREDAAQEVYRNVHAVLHPGRARDRLQQSSRAKGASASEKRPLSVLVLGLDSVSRLNFQRAMPLTRAYLEERGWSELRGYNKIGDNTFPNLMAVLAGRGETGGASSGPECDARAPLDRCPMIWYDFRDAGYATAYAEDTAAINTFSNAKVGCEPLAYDDCVQRTCARCPQAGFAEPPTDYYLRPYVLATEQLLPTRRRFGWTYCAGPELAADRIFDAALEFARDLGDGPYFGFFWSNSLSHEDLNGPSAYDRRFADKLLRLESGGAMESSMLLLLSDHGMRFGGIRETFVGWYEERLPVAYVWLPRWFREQEPRAYEALLANRDRLTSPYDLHETLGDVLRRAGAARAPGGACPRCSSLLAPVPRERGCRDAGISPHWCTCAAFEPYNASDPIAIQGASKFVEYVNGVTESYTTNLGIRLCSRLKLKRILGVKRMLDFDADPNPLGQALKLFYSLELTPGGGKFETTITYHGLGEYTLREEEVSRINLYGHDAMCLDKGHKKYCQCRFNVAYSILRWF